MRVAGLAPSEGREEAQSHPVGQGLLGLSVGTVGFQTWPKVTPSILMIFHL